MMIIDMRSRPPYGSFLLDGSMYKEEVLQNGAKRYGCEVSEAALQRNIELFIREMDEAGIDKAVAPVRITRNGDNKSTNELIQKYPNRIIGMLGINPLDDTEFSVNEIDRYILHGSFTGINIEPGFTPEPYCKDALKCNNRVIYPIYEKCQQEDIPVLLSFGGLCHEGIDNFSPEMLDQVLGDFPKLKVIIAHGGWPWIPQVFWLAFRRGNLWISPDVYVLAGGGFQYIEAAKYFAKGRILFGSAYPACNMKKAVEFYQKFGMEEEIYKQVMREAAKEVLGI